MDTQRMIIRAFLECKTHIEVNHVLRKYMDEVLNNPGLKDLLRSTIKRINAVRTVRELNAAN